MGRGDDVEPGEIEWIEDAQLGGGDVVHTRAPRGPGRRPSWWYGLAAAVLVVALIVVARARSSPHPDAQPSPSASVSSPVSSPAASPAQSAAQSGPVEAPVSVTPSVPAVAVRQVGHPVLNVPTSWELFARGPNVVVRIQLAAGRVTTTKVPDLSSESPVSFVITPDRALIRPLDHVVGFQVADNTAVTDLKGALAAAGPAVPGPDPGHVWAPAMPNGQLNMSLVDLSGRPGTTVIPIPADAGLAASDGNGYLLLYGTGGVYDARPGGLHRITTGQLLAIGPTGWLTVECDEQYRCSTTITDRASGAHRALKTPVGLYQQGGGVISPDGRTAALLSSDANGQATLHLLDLVTGVDRPVDQPIDQSASPSDGSVVWSPDSARLFMAAATGAVSAINRDTGHASALGVTLPPVTQLGFRH
jgi:hypothetical protein